MDDIVHISPSRVPLLSCSSSRCSTGQFNVHPFCAGCFPAAPVQGADLRLVPQGHTPLWFTFELLEHRCVQRQHVQRLAGSTAAAAQQASLQQLVNDPLPHVSDDAVRRVLSAALGHYAAMRVLVRADVQPAASTSLVAHCCAVSRQGHPPCVAPFESSSSLQQVPGGSGSAAPRGPGPAAGEGA